MDPAARAWRHAVIVLFAMLAAGWERGAAAQDYPSRPTRFLVGFPAGGASDVVARLAGQKLAQQLGHAVVVDNRPGAAGNIAAELVSRAHPDGYTIFLGSISLATNATLYRTLNYEALRDLDAVGQLTANPYLLVVHPGLPVKSVKELIAMAKLQPARIHYASAGNGSGAHLFAALFFDTAGVDISHIPYTGSAPATRDLLAGRVQMQFDNVIVALPLAKGGRLRALGVSTVNRVSIAPDIPTIAESGLPGYNASSWFGVFVPAGTPGVVVARLNVEINTALRDADLRERLLALGNEAAGGTPEQFGRFFRAEVARWGQVIRKANVRVD